MRISATLGGVLFSIFVGRVFGADGLGVVAIAQSSVYVLSLFFMFGTDRALVRFVAISPRNTGGFNLRELYLLMAGRLVLMASIVVTAACIIGVSLWLGSEAELYFRSVYFWFLLSLVPIVGAQLMSAYWKGRKHTVFATMLEQGMISLYATILAVGVSYLSGASLSLLGLAKCYFASCCIVMCVAAISACLVFKDGRSPVGDGSIDRRGFWSASTSFLLVGVLVYILTSGFVLIAGAALSDEEVGLIRAAERLGLVVSFVLAVVNNIYPPRLAYFWSVGDLRRLHRLFVRARRVSCGFALMVGLPLWFFPDYFLGLMLPGVASAGVVRLFLLGCFANAAFGPVGNLLSMTGNEQVSRNIACAVVLIALPSYWFAMVNFGAIGAALSFALISLFWGGMLTIASYALLWQRKGY